MRYLKVFFTMYSARLGKDFSLPVSTQLFQLLGSVCYFFMHYLAFRLLLSRFNFPGWTLNQSWVLLFTFEIFTYLAFFLFWNGLNKTVQDINSGRFDMVVSKPMSSLFITFFRGGGLHNLICTLLGFIFLIITCIKSGMFPSILYFPFFVLLIFSSLWSFFCLSVCFISLNFRFGYLTATPSLAFQVQEVYKYPSTLYRSLPFLTGVLPIVLSLFTSVPAAVLASIPLPVSSLFLYSAFLIIITVISRVLWLRGLRQYSSASS